MQQKAFLEQSFDFIILKPGENSIFSHNIFEENKKHRAVLHQVIGSKEMVDFRNPTSKTYLYTGRS